jgi:hypothetical protein
MLRVVKRAILSQCWFHLNSPVYVRRDRIDAGAGAWAICVEARDIRIHQRHESYPCECDVAGQVLKQSLKLMSMSSDSIHDAVFVCREKGAAHLRDQLTLRY